MINVTMPPDLDAAVERPDDTARDRVRRTPADPGEANAIQQGRTQQLWQVEIRRPDDDKLVARGQVRLQNIDPEDA
jgi:acyl-coenzyme A thioesterase PaaI-like protein